MTSAIPYPDPSHSVDPAGVAEEHFVRADALLEELLPHHSRWAPERRDWIFRGQADHEWKLEPSSVRSSTPMGDDWMRTGPGATHRAQIHLELGMLRHFVTYADVQALTIPDSAQILDLLRSGPTTLEDAKLNTWPPKTLYAPLALAQHYGIATRLLDWSRKSFIAAYFAAREAAEALQQGKKGTLAIWALRWRQVQKNLLEAANVEWISAPRSSNANLHLQSGVFILHRPAIRDLDTPFGAQPYETFLPTVAALHKLTLPWTEAPRLLRLLATNFVHGATVYGGFEGAAKSVLERRLREG